MSSVTEAAATAAATAADAARAARVVRAAGGAGGAGNANAEREATRLAKLRKMMGLVPKRAGALEPVLKRTPGPAVKFNPLVTASNLSEAPLTGNRRFGNGGASFSKGEVYANQSLELHKRRGPHPELHENAEKEGLWGYGLTQEQKRTMSPEELKERRRAVGEDRLEAVLSRRAARVKLATTKPTRENKKEAALLNAAVAAREAAAVREAIAPEAVLASEKSLGAARATISPSVPDWKRKTRNNRSNRSNRKTRTNRKTRN
jgi:hypothetical protein